MPEKLYLDKEQAKVDHAYFAEKLLNFKAFEYQEKVNWAKPKIL